MSEILPILALVTAFLVLLLLYRPALAAPLFGLAAPLGLVSLPGGIQLVIALSILLIFVAILERFDRGLTPFPMDAPTLLAFIWTVGIVISVLASQDPGRAAIFGTWQIVVVFLALAWAELAGSRGQVRVVLGSWLVGAIAVALTGPLGSPQGLQAAYGGAVVTGRPVGVFGQPNEYGLYCMIALIFAVVVCVLTTRWLRWLALALVVSATVGLVLSLSRGAWVGAAVGIVAVLVFVPQSRRAVTTTLVVGGALFAGALVVAPGAPVLQIVTERLTSISDRGANPYDNRPAYLAEGVREWLARPWFGQGPNMYPVVSQGVTSVARPGGAEHPHNFLLAVGAEQGVVGLLVIFGFVAVVIAAAVRARRLIAPRDVPASERPRQPSMGAVVTMAGACALLAFAVEGFADFPMRNALARTTVWLMVGWVLAGSRLMADDVKWQRIRSQAGKHPQTVSSPP